MSRMKLINLVSATAAASILVGGPAFAQALTPPKGSTSLAHWPSRLFQAGVEGTLIDRVFARIASGNLQPPHSQATSSKHPGSSPASTGMDAPTSEPRFVEVWVGSTRWRFNENAILGQIGEAKTTETLSEISILLDIDSFNPFSNNQKKLNCFPGFDAVCPGALRIVISALDSANSMDPSGNLWRRRAERDSVRWRGQ